jgi:predicted acylesterase/phospholipase RssA
MAKTIYFKNCLGAFQGGGCRAAAFVGAYAEAVRRGVTFSSVVGTSAGSIVATLIAAGASLTDLETIIARLDFKEFLRPAISTGSGSVSARLLSLVTKKAGLIDRLGMHSSEYIEQFMEAELKKLLPQSHSPVQFRDLPKPVAVVATDLRTRNVKVWSSVGTPEDEVSVAVRASCSIPLFFQPVQNRYVDGGVLSNLPSFVFEGSQLLSDRVLAFCLRSDDGHELPVTSLPTLIKSLADTLIEGAQDLQLRLQKEVHLITIDTGTLKATDFDLMNAGAIKTLVTNGVAATTAFFDEETLRVKSKSGHTDLCATYMQTYKAIAQTVGMPIDEVIVSETTTDWVYKLFPTVLYWRSRGAMVSVLLRTNTDDKKHGPFRQRLLTAMGCDVSQIDDLPFRGFLFNPREEDTALGIVRSERTKEGKSYDGVVYSGRTDFTILSMLRASAEAHIAPLKQSPPALLAGDEDEIRTLLKQRVHQYTHPFVDISFATVKVADLATITKFVTGFKYTQVDELFDLYQTGGLPLFAPAKLRYYTGKETILMPPVVEVHGSKNLVIEGTTRCTYSHRNDVAELFVCLVKGVRAPLPSSKTFSLEEAVISDEAREGDSRYDGFTLEHFRSIERAVRDPETTLL